MLPCALTGTMIPIAPIFMTLAGQLTAWLSVALLVASAASRPQTHERAIGGWSVLIVAVSIGSLGIATWQLVAGRPIAAGVAGGAPVAVCFAALLAMRRTSA